MQTFLVTFPTIFARHNRKYCALYRDQPRRHPFVAMSKVQVPCVDFLDAYPHPAFVLPISPAILGAPSFNAVYANAAYKAVFAPRSTAATLDLRLVESLESPAEVKKLGSWLLKSLSDHTYSNIVIRFRPQWLDSNHPSLELELTCTLVDTFWLCTSVPRASASLPLPLSAAVSSRKSSLSPR